MAGAMEPERLLCVARQALKWGYSKEDETDPPPPRGVGLGGKSEDWGRTSHRTPLAWARMAVSLGEGMGDGREQGWG